MQPDDGPATPCATAIPCHCSPAILLHAAILAEDLGTWLDTLAMEMHERLLAHGITLTLQGIAEHGHMLL